MNSTLSYPHTSELKAGYCYSFGVNYWEADNVLLQSTASKEDVLFVFRSRGSSKLVCFTVDYLQMAPGFFLPKNMNADNDDVINACLLEDKKIFRLENFQGDSLV